MRHRNNFTGLGNPNDEILPNNFDFPKELKDFADDFIDNFKVPKEYNGFDFSFWNSQLRVGIEPTYAGEELEIVCFDLDDKSNCWWSTGMSFGGYGTGIRSSIKFYGDYKKKGKFVKFIDKWYDIVKSEMKKVKTK